MTVYTTAFSEMRRTRIKKPAPPNIEGSLVPCLLSRSDAHMMMSTACFSFFHETCARAFRMYVRRKIPKYMDSNDGAAKIKFDIPLMQTR